MTDKYAKLREAAEKYLAERTIYVCDGCGTVTNDPITLMATYRAAGKISCCPERKMIAVEVGSILAAEKARADAAETEAKFAYGINANHEATIAALLAERERRTSSPGWPDPLESPQADAIRSGKIDDVEIRNLFDQMEREIQVHRKAFCERRTPDVVTVPDGWALVPIEPTEAMVERAQMTNTSDLCDADVEDIYRTMLRAAPSLSSGAGRSEERG